MSRSTVETYDRFFGQFVDWVQSSYGQGSTARTAIASIKNGLGVVAPREIAGGGSLPTTPLNETEVLMAWPIVKANDYPLYVVLRTVYELGIEYRALLGGRGYPGLMGEDILQVGRQWFIDLRIRGGGIYRYRVTEELARELADLEGKNCRKAKGRPQQTEVKNLWGITDSAMYHRLRRVLRILQGQGIVRKHLRGAFGLWQFSPRVRLYKDPRFRDAREVEEHPLYTPGKIG